VWWDALVVEGYRGLPALRGLAVSWHFIAKVSGKRRQKHLRSVSKVKGVQLNPLEISLECLPTPTRREKNPFFKCTLREYLKKRFWRSTWLPTPLEDVSRRFPDDGSMRRRCPHLYVKLLEVVTSSSPVRSAEAESWLKRCVRAGAAFTGS